MGMGAASVHYGVGQHLIYIKPEDVIRASKWNRIGQIPLVLSTMFTKLSISMFVFRIFAVQKSSRRALYPVIVLNVVGNLASIRTILSQCSHAKKLWDPSIPGKCWDPKVQVDIGIFNGGRAEHYVCSHH